VAAGRAEILFGPYGSGSGRAVAEAMAGRPEVVWNHGAAAVPRTGARMVDVLGPAGSYWRGLPAALALCAPDAAVAVIRAPGGFGAEVAAGAGAALTAAGRGPVLVRDLEPGGASAAVDAALVAGAGWIVGGGRAEDDLALARAASGRCAVALVVCGVALAGEELGAAVTGALGPAQWDGTPPPPPFALPPGADYPAAQALAAALVAERALALAGSPAPDALWAAARALRLTTHIGPFAVDAAGRQVAHAPCLVRWEPAAAGPARVVIWRPSGAEA
jgi:branched-chain amino acid transport system substrate-binding protein